MSLKSILKESRMVHCERNESIERIVKLMQENDVGAVVVTESKRPIGIITDRDLVLRCLSQGQRGLDMRAQDVMSSPVETVPEEAGIYDVITRMNTKGVRRVCVVNNSGECLTLISSGDVLELWSKEIAALASATVPDREKLLKREESAA